MKNPKKETKKFWYYYMDEKDRVHKTSDIEKFAKYSMGRKTWQIESVPRKGVRISTVFLTVDYTFGMSKPPILFETMIFGGARNRETRRYSTKKQAEQGHDAIVRSFKS